MKDTKEILLEKLAATQELIQSQTQEIEKLQSNEQHLTSMLQFSRDIIINVDSESRIIFWNKAAEAEFGYSSEEIIGQAITQIMPVHLRNMHMTGLQRVVETGKTKIIGTIVEVIGLRKDKTEFPMELSLSSWAEGDEFFFGSIIRNITLRKETEQSLENSKNELQDALIKEKELGALKDRFMTMIAHEFRTPLTIISVSTQLLSRYFSQLTDAKREEHLSKIQMQINNLTYMLEGIGTMLQNNTHSLHLKLETISLKDCCENVILGVKQTIESNHTISLQCEDEFTEIQADKKFIYIIIRNLLSNAIKYSNTNSQIEINISSHKQGQLLQIRDEGIGIPSSDLKWIFTPYHRAENVENIKGIGLGLQIVKELVELHYGTITVQSKVNDGTTFNVYLPQNAHSQDPSETQSTD